MPIDTAVPPTNLHSHLTFIDEVQQRQGRQVRTKGPSVRTKCIEVQVCIRIFAHSSIIGTKTLGVMGGCKCMYGIT